MNKVIQLNSSYYVQHSQALVKLGMRDPSEDTDERYRLVWEYIIKHQLKLRVESNYDFESKLGSRESKHYGDFQARQSCEDSSSVEDYYSTFYENNKSQKRVIIGFEMETYFFPSVGNHRSRAHKMGQNKGFESRGHVLIVGDGLSQEEKRKHGLEIAAISNRESDDDVNPETEYDIEHQLNRAWELEKQLYPNCATWDTKKKTEWARDWVVARKPKYSLASRSKRLSRIVNSLFAEHRVQSLPFPDNSKIAQQFVMFFPKSDWNPENSNKIIQKRFPTRYDFVSQELYRLWKDRTTATPVRDKVWIAARVGKVLDANITSSITVESGRIGFLNAMSENNKNVNHIQGGFPIVERIMFVKQSESDSYEAWEWNYQTEEFDEVISFKALGL